MIRERTSYALCFNNVLTNMFHGSPIEPRIIDDWIHGISNELQDEIENHINVADYLTNLSILEAIDLMIRSAEENGLVYIEDRER